MSYFLFEARGAGAMFVQKAHRESPGIPRGLSAPADWSKYITSSCKVDGLEVDGPTSIGSFWSISNVAKSPSSYLSSLWSTVSCTEA